MQTVCSLLGEKSENQFWGMKSTLEVTRYWIQNCVFFGYSHLTDLYSNTNSDKEVAAMGDNNEVWRQRNIFVISLLSCSAHECLIYVCIIPCSPSTIDAVETKGGYSAVRKHLRKEMCWGRSPENHHWTIECSCTFCSFKGVMQNTIVIARHYFCYSAFYIRRYNHAILFRVMKPYFISTLKLLVLALLGMHQIYSSHNTSFQ